MEMLPNCSKKKVSMRISTCSHRVRNMCQNQGYTLFLSNTGEASLKAAAEKTALFKVPLHLVKIVSFLQAQCKREKTEIKAHNGGGEKHSSETSEESMFAACKCAHHVILRDR